MSKPTRVNFDMRYKEFCSYLYENYPKFPNTNSRDTYEKSLAIWFQDRKKKIKKCDVELREKLSVDERVKENIDCYMNKPTRVNFYIRYKEFCSYLYGELS